jgi:hypothetical protein
MGSGADARFVGMLDSGDDLAAAAQIAQGCAGFSADEDDECYAPEEVSCFNCRARRWQPDGFTCMRGLLGG